MKPQDIFFIILLLVLLYKRKPEWITVAGLTLLLVSIPLFYYWVFFTAQRFVIYAAVFFLIAIVFHLISIRK